MKLCADMVHSRQQVPEFGDVLDAVADVASNLTDLGCRVQGEVLYKLVMRHGAIALGTSHARVLRWVHIYRVDFLQERCNGVGLRL